MVKLSISEIARKKTDYVSLDALARKPAAWFMLISDEELPLDGTMEFISLRGEEWGKYTAYGTREEFLSYMAHRGVHHGKYDVLPSGAPSRKEYSETLALPAGRYHRAARFISISPMRPNA